MLDVLNNLILVVVNNASDGVVPIIISAIIPIILFVFRKIYTVYKDSKEIGRLMKRSYKINDDYFIYMRSALEKLSKEQLEQIIVSLDKTKNIYNVQISLDNLSKKLENKKIKKFTFVDKIIAYYISSITPPINVNREENIKEKVLTNTETLTLKLLKEKASASTKTYIIGYITFGIVLTYYIATTIFSLPTMNTSILFFSVFFLFLCYFKQYLFEYRVKKGFYGTCYSEAKELVEYIVNNNKKDKNDGGTPVFLNEEIETYALNIIEGETVYNG